MIGKLVRSGSLIGATMAAGMILATPSFAAPGAALPAAPSSVENVTFWAQPFPYGYRHRSASCVRHVRVATRNGTRLRRVWICR